MGFVIVKVSRFRN